MSDTPRTDAAQDNVAAYQYKDGETVMMVNSDFARQLERELAAKERELEALLRQHVFQLAAISTASISNTEVTYKQVSKNIHDDFRTTAFNDVLAAIKREMNHRNNLTTLQQVARELAEKADKYKQHSACGFKHCEHQLEQALTTYNSLPPEVKGQ